jgi:hypothetical protein
MDGTVLGGLIVTGFLILFAVATVLYVYLRE